MQTLNINGKEITLCNNPQWISQLGNSKQIAIPNMLFSVVDYVIPLICSDLEDAIQMAKTFNYLSIREKFYITATVLLFDGLDSQLRAELCNVFRIFKDAGWIQNANGNISIINFDKVLDKTVDFILNLDYNDITDIPFRNKTGLSRKSYVSKIRTLIFREIIRKKKIISNREANYLADRGIGLEGYYAKFIALDIKDLMEGKITRMNLNNLDRKVSINSIKILSVRDQGIRDNKRYLEIKGQVEYNNLIGKESDEDSDNEDLFNVDIDLICYYNINNELAILYIDSIIGPYTDRKITIDKRRLTALSNGNGYVSDLH